MKIRKILAVCMSVMMLFSVLPTAALAADTDNPEDTDSQELVTHEHDFETNPPVLSEDGTKLVYTCAVEGCEETYEEDYVPDTPTTLNEGDVSDSDGEIAPQSAEEEGVAQIGENTYETLAKAIENVSDSSQITIILLKDATEETLTIGQDKNIVLDLGRNTLTLSSSQTITDEAYTKAGITSMAALLNEGTFAVENGTLVGADSARLIANKGTLNVSEGAKLIKNTSGNVIDNLGGTVNTTGTIQTTVENADAIVTFGGEVNVNGGEIQATGSGISSAVTIFNRDYSNDGSGAKVTINGGVLEANAYVASTNNVRSGGKEPSNLTINGGVLRSVSGTAIYWPSAGELIIGKEAGTDTEVQISGHCAVQICSGTLVLNHGTLEAAGENTYVTDQELVNGFRTHSGSNADGSALSVIAQRSLGYTTTPLQITVNGGVLTSDKNSAMRYMDCNLAKNVSDTSQYSQSVNVSIVGGEFKGGTALSDSTAVPAVDAGYIQNEDKNFISGGTFVSGINGNSSDVGSYLADGFKYNEDGTVTDKAVASVNGEKYDSLQKAIGAAEGNEATTITLLANTTENVIIDSGKNIILDLNGKTLSGGITKAKAAITNNGTVKIVDSSTEKNGTIKREDSGNGGYYVIVNNGIMTFEDGYVYNGTGTPTVWGGASLICNGLSQTGTMYVNGGTFEQYNFIVFKNEEHGQLYIKGGTIKSDAQAVQNWHEAEIAGGTISGDVSTWAYDECAGSTIIKEGTTINGDVLACWYNAQSNYPAKKAPSVTISGGTIIGDLSKKSTVDGSSAQIESESSEAGKIEVSGGVFSKAVAEEYCAEGFVPVANDDGKYGVKEGKYVVTVQNGEGIVKKYESMHDAYEAAKDGDVIKALEDTDWEQASTDDVSSVYGFNIRKSICIDLNGHTINLKMEGKTKGFYLYLSVQDVTLTIEDTSTDGKGKITTTNDTYLIWLNKGNLVLKSGTLESNATRTVYLKNSASEFTMSGGELINAKARGDSNNANVLEVSSGTATISEGLIKASNENDPVPGVKISGTSADVTINGGNFSTGKTQAIWKYNAGKLMITGGSFNGTTGPSIYTTTGGSTIIGSNDSQTGSFELPGLALNSTGVVEVKDNVTIKKITAIPVSDSTKYTFSVNNIFGGQYGNDFTDNISGNALCCEKISDNGYYKVVSMEEDDARVVAVITRGDDRKLWFGEFGAAMSALQNGDTLTLKKSVTNDGATSWRSTASKAVIDLGEYDITATAAVSGLYFNPPTAKMESGDEIIIKGTGTITGKERAIYVQQNGPDTYTYTLNVDENVKLQTVDQGDEKYPINMFATGARLKINSNMNEEALTNLTNNRFETEVGGQKYIYCGLAKAVQDTTNDNVVMLADCKATGSIELKNPKLVTIDLKGYVLTLAKNSFSGIMSNGSGVIIKNGTIQSNYNNKTYFSYPIGIEATGESGSSLELDNVVLNVTGQKAVALTVNGKLDNVTVNLKNSKINCSGTGETGETVGVYFPVKGGTLTISGTEITAQNAVQVKGGTVYVEDGSEITSTGAKAEPGNESSGCTNTGDGIYVEDTYGFNPVVYVKGGTVKSENGSALNYFDNEQDNATGKIEVSGGIFSSKVLEEYCAENYIPTDVDENGMYTVTRGPKVYGRTLTLDGTIGVNYYVDMSGVDEADRANYNMMFTVNGESEEVQYNSNAYRTFNGTKYHRFTCYVAAKQMTDTITAQLMNGSTAVSKEYKYSVKTYCDNAIKNSGNNTLSNLLRAMLNYGGYAQTYFDYNTNNLANAGLYDVGNNPVSEVTVNNLLEYAMKPEGEELSGISLGATLLLESDTTIRFYISLNNAEISKYKFFINGTEYQPIENTGETVNPDAGYYIEVKGITVQNLDTPYKLTVRDADNNSYSVSYSALSYAYNTIINGNNSDALNNTVKALYLYSQAAKGYTNWLKN